MLEDSLKLQYEIDLKKIGSGRNSVKKKKSKHPGKQTSFILIPSMWFFDPRILHIFEKRHRLKFVR